MIQQVNLYKAEFRPQRLILSVRHLLLGWGMVVFGCGLFTLYLVSFVEEKRSVLSEEQRTEQNMATQIATLEKKLSNRTRDTRLLEKNQRLKSLLSKGARLLLAVNGRASELNPGHSIAAVLRGLAGQVREGIWLNEILIGNRTELTIGGVTTRAELVPVYIKQLGVEHVFQGKRFADLSLHSEPGTDVMTFRIASTPDGPEAAHGH